MKETNRLLNGHRVKRTRWALAVCLLTAPLLFVVLSAQPKTVTQAQAESVLYQAQQALENRASRAAPNGHSDTLATYAAKCDAATGITVPQFSCSEGTLVPGQGAVPATTRNATFCDKPNILNGHCDPGSTFHVLPGGTADAVAVATCRKVGLPIAGSSYNDIAVIQYNKANGAVCFYQALTNLPGEHIPSPRAVGTADRWSDGLAHWLPPADTERIGCTGCHNNGGFIRSPYLAQLKTLPDALPSRASGFDNLSTPLRYVGLDYKTNRSWSITARSENTCTSCHRLAVSNSLGFGIVNGSGGNFAKVSTAEQQDSKNPHSPGSPIWMIPGQVTYSAAAATAAKKIQTCAVAFFNSGFVSPGPDCEVTALGESWKINGPRPKVLTGDYNHDGWSDIPLLPARGDWWTMPVAFAKGNGTWQITNEHSGDFGGWAKAAGVVPLTGDFNNDGWTDVALLRQTPGWGSMPVAFSKGNGTWQITNESTGAFAAWATTPGVIPLTGDFNHDGFTDVALLRQEPGWTTMPVAFASGNGTWQITNEPIGAFAGWAAMSGAVPLSGDFNHDGWTDIALLRRTAGWTSMPVAFARGNGTWLITNESSGDFAAWATAPGVAPLTGDFNHDGWTDVALLRQTGGWGTMPVAFAKGNGTWQITNESTGDFAAWATTPGVVPLTGDFNHDGWTDVALLRQTAGWSTMPVAFAKGNGTWQITNESTGGFAAWATAPGVVPLTGDFNHDGWTDVALLRQTAGWTTLPVAFAKGNGAWQITNETIGQFAEWATGIVP